MGIMDKARDAKDAAIAHAAQQRAESEAAEAARREAIGQIGRACPGGHYKTEVNKGSIRMQTWESHLNDMYRQGYRLSHVFEQDGNTVQVYEHSFH